MLDHLQRRRVPLAPDQRLAQRRSEGFARQAIIVGGGASGVLLAYQLLQSSLELLRDTHRETSASRTRTGLSHRQPRPFAQCTSSKYERAAGSARSFLALGVDTWRGQKALSRSLLFCSPSRLRRLHRQLDPTASQLGAGFANVWTRMCRTEEIGAALSMRCGRSPSACGVSFHSHPNEVSLSTRAHGGTLIVTAWRRRWRRA
jgi:hypothetical protein